MDFDTFDHNGNLINTSSSEGLEQELDAQDWDLLKRAFMTDPGYNALRLANQLGTRSLEDIAFADTIAEPETYFVPIWNGIVSNLEDGFITQAYIDSWNSIFDQAHLPFRANASGFLIAEL